MVRSNKILDIIDYEVSYITFHGSANVAYKVDRSVITQVGFKASLMEGHYHCNAALILDRNQ